jgi:hypothetical protein
MRYFEVIVEHPAFPGVATIGSAFLSKIPIDVLSEICRRADRLIDRSPGKLSLFIDAMMPNLMRLSGSVEPACDLVISWIGNMSLDISEGFRETLLDSIEAAYWLIDLRTVSPRVDAAIREKVPESRQTAIRIRLELDS